MPVYLVFVFQRRRREEKKSGVWRRLRSCLVCAVCDVVGCWIPTNQVCDDASFFWWLCGHPLSPVTTPLLPSSFTDIGFKLQLITVRVCLVFLPSVTTYSCKLANNSTRSELKISRGTFFFSTEGGRRRNIQHDTTVLRLLLIHPTQPPHVIRLVLLPPNSFSQYYQHICLFDFFFLLLPFGSCSYLPSIIFILSSPLIHL